MRPPPQQSSQNPSQVHHHNHHHVNNHQKSPVIPDHCCSCNNCNNQYSDFTKNHVQHNSHTTTSGLTGNAATAPSTTTNNDKDYYNLCECTSCRNLGNSIDICCQCCSCSAEQNYGPRYHVASMAMQEDTLEVCLQQQTAVDPHAGHAHTGGSPACPTADDIALAHNMAERAGMAGCYECHSTNQGCCGSGPSAPRGSGQHAPARGPPMFHGWQQHHGQQGRRTLPKGHPAAAAQSAGHSCAGKGSFSKKPVPPENVSLYLLIFSKWPACNFCNSFIIYIHISM